MGTFKGLRSFTGDEVGNIVIGQMGFCTLDVSTSTSVGTNDAGDPVAAGTANKFTDKTFVAIKVMKNGATGTVGFHAETLIGDSPLTLTDVADGDIIYGPFKYIQGRSSGTTGQLICYFGGDQ
jgi:hypothetical protein